MLPAYSTKIPAKSPTDDCTIDEEGRDDGPRGCRPDAAAEVGRGKRWQVPHLAPVHGELQIDRRVEPFAGGLAVALGLSPARATLNVALFLPFPCTKERQTAATGGTKRNPKIDRFSVRRGPIWQRPANHSKGRLTTSVPPVNRRVAGSNPARGAIS
jgi:hypothetical protein